VLPKKNRVPSFLIPKLLKKGNRVGGNALTLVYKKSNQQKNNRWAFIVPTKACKKAVGRNKIKRRLRNIVARINLQKNGFDLVILVNEKLISKKFEQMKAEVKNLLQKAEIIETLNEIKR